MSGRTAWESRTRCPPCSRPGTPSWPCRRPGRQGTCRPRGGSRHTSWSRGRRRGWRRSTRRGSRPSRRRRCLRCCSTRCPRRHKRARRARRRGSPRPRGGASMRSVRSGSSPCEVPSVPRASGTGRLHRRSRPAPSVPWGFSADSALHVWLGAVRRRALEAHGVHENSCRAPEKNPVVTLPRSALSRSPPGEIRLKGRRREGGGLCASCRGRTASSTKTCPFEGRTAPATPPASRGGRGNP